MLKAEEIRDAQRATWAGLSGGWEKWDLVIMDQLGPVTTVMIERLDIARNQQHLDIAAGTGDLGLSIARLVPKGRVVLTDLVAEMLDVAARRADALGVTNIETKVCSAAAPGHVSAAYEAAGLCDVAECDVDVELVTSSPAQYWEMMSEHVSLAVAALHQVDEAARERIRSTVIASVSAFEHDGKVRVPGVARCIVGTK